MTWFSFQECTPYDYLLVLCYDCILSIVTAAAAAAAASVSRRLYVRVTLFIMQQGSDTIFDANQHGHDANEQLLHCARQQAQSGLLKSNSAIVSHQGIRKLSLLVGCSRRLTWIRSSSKWIRRLPRNKRHGELVASIDQHRKQLPFSLLIAIHITLLWWGQNSYHVM